jgi:xanthine dehydrogenase YagR molybdenum-binding subunit
VSARVIGTPLDRVDGRAKVTGGARYAADALETAPLYAVIVQSTIPRGRIGAIDESATRAVPGVVEIMTYRNAPRVPVIGFSFELPYSEQLAPLQDEQIHYDGQHVAVVLAWTYEAAREGAALLRIDYEGAPARSRVADVSEFDTIAEFYGSDAQSRRGEPERAYEASEVTVDATYRTPEETHNPLEPSATIARWDGNALIVHDATQWVNGTRASLMAAFKLDATQVRVVSPFVGGGFGCKGFFWPHALLAAMSARLTGQPVKLVLTREQMFTSCGHRSETEQRLRLGSSRTGTLQAIIHDVVTSSSRVGTFLEPAGLVSAYLVACPNVAVTHRTARLDIPTPTAMRAPGESTGTYGLGCALDELAERLGLDPLELLRRNHADVDGETGRRYSSKHLLECYTRGAERFGWERRTAAPRSMRENGEYVGWGVATATYPALRAPAEARITIDRDGRIEVASATHDLGTGMYTILAQVAAEGLDVDPRDIVVRIGDSAFPPAPVAGGSMSTASVAPAVQDAASQLRQRALEIALGTAGSPLSGLRREEVTFAGGQLRANDDATRALSYAQIAQLAGRTLEAIGGAAPSEQEQKYALRSFGAQFCEVRYDEELARVRVTRALGIFDCGRVLNPKTARSQMIGGIVWGIGMALLEETVRDPRSGAVVTNNLADYHLPVNADIPAIDVLFVEEPDLILNPLGARGMGEIGITGVAAALANAVYHASGVRVRDLPITAEKLLAGAPVRV